MAQTLRETLTGRSVTISHAESLELVAKMLGVQDWNTLSALLKTPQPPQPTAKPPQHPTRYPAIPVRDFVPFPGMEFPLYIGREKTMLALDRAFSELREIVVAAQQDPSQEEPDFTNIYKTGVLATVLDIQRLPDGHTFKGKQFNNVTKVLLQAQRRVTIHNFTANEGAFHAEITNISEGKIPEAPELVKEACERFATYQPAAEIDLHRSSAIEQARLRLKKIQNPGRVADIIATHSHLPIRVKQSLLETLDPIARLQQVITILDSAER
jgi:ATP-dependent Lon protease